MAFRDILIVLTTYPDPTSLEEVDRAVVLAAALGGNVAAVTFQAELEPTRSSSYLANMLIGLPELMKDANAISAANARKLLSAFETCAGKKGFTHESILERCIAFQVPDMLVDHARLRDLTIIPLQGSETIEQSFAEAVIFGSGRPTILVPGALGPTGLAKLETITVAWDFSRPAARALADAIPILRKAKRVRVVTVTNEKKIETTRSHEQLAKHLARHDIKISLEQIDAENRAVGDVLISDIKSSDSDLLVMGAYGHSRTREFVLGGATRTMLARPPVPVFLSH